MINKRNERLLFHVPSTNTSGLYKFWNPNEADSIFTEIYTWTKPSEQCLTTARIVLRRPSFFSSLIERCVLQIQSHQSFVF